MLIKQSSSNKVVPFFLVDSTDHITGKTGLTPTVTISKNGAAFGTPAGAVTEIGSGWYKIAANATDSNTVGSLLVHATATGADPFDVIHEVVEATLAKGTDITGFNDLSAANVQTELVTYGALKPTTAGRTLDVTTTGEAGIDWANIGAPATTQALSATTIATVTTLTNDPPGVTTLLARITSTLFTGITSLKEWLGLLAGKQVGNATARTEIRSSGAGSGTFDETVDSQEALRDRGDAAWITGAGGDPWATAVPGAYGAGTAGNILGSRLDVAISTRATPAQVQTELGTYGALKPTVAARTLDVSTGGEAGIDWANVGTPGSTNNLSATTIATLTNAPADSAGVTTLLTRIPAALFSGITSLAQWLGMLAGKQVGNTTARTEIRATGAGAGTFDEVTDSQEAIRDRGDISWITGAGGDPWLTALPGAYGAGTAGNIIGGNLNATVSSRATPAQVQTELGTYGALKPTVAARTLDVNATGEAGIDWANIGAPTTTQNLSATTIATVGTLTNAPPDSSGVTTLLTRIPAALFGGITSLAQWLGMIAGKQTGNATARTELRATGAGSGAYDETTDSQEAIRDRGDAAWTTGGGAGSDPWLTVLPAAYGAGTAGNILGNNLNATVSSRATQASVDTIGTNVTGIKSKTDNLPVDPADASDLAASFTVVNGKLDAIDDYVDTEISAIKSKTDALPANPASVSDIPTAIQNADALLKRDMAAVTGEASRSPLNAMRLLRNKWSAVETPNTLTVKREDDVTTAWTASLTTDSSAAPITSADPG